MRKGAGNVSGSVLSRDQVSNQVNNQVEDIRLKLTSTQNRIITFCTSPRSAQEIMDEIGVTNQYNNRQRQFIVESEWLTNVELNLLHRAKRQSRAQGLMVNG